MSYSPIPLHLIRSVAFLLWRRVAVFIPRSLVTARPAPRWNGFPIHLLYLRDLIITALFTGMPLSCRTPAIRTCMNNLSSVLLLTIALPGWPLNATAAFILHPAHYRDLLKQDRIPISGIKSGQPLH